MSKLHDISEGEMHEKGAGKILVVDDDEQITSLVRLLLESRGWTCILAHSGAQGLSQFEKADIDLIVTDLNMGIGDGLEMIRSVREKSDVPILVITGYAKEFADQVRFLPNVFLFGKPVDATALLKQVRISYRLQRRAKVCVS